MSMGILTMSPFNLTLGDMIVARVSATNEKGEGEYSDSNSVGALAEVLPLAPKLAPSRGELTSEIQLDVGWQFLTTYA